MGDARGPKRRRLGWRCGPPGAQKASSSQEAFCPPPTRAAHVVTRALITRVATVQRSGPLASPRDWLIPTQSPAAHRGHPPVGWPKEVKIPHQAEGSHPLASPPSSGVPPPLQNLQSWESNCETPGEPGKTSRDGRVRMDRLFVFAWVQESAQQDVGSQLGTGSPRALLVHAPPVQPMRFAFQS
jgi:hypothetical protein